MNSSKRLSTLIFVGFCLVILILFGNTAIEGAKNGINICLQTVIPSLFPFLFLSSILTGSLSATGHQRSSVVCRLYSIPKGSQGILLTGLLGGYPVGAKCVGDAVSQSKLSPADAERMIVFCNAIGPSFLFGMIGSIFTQNWVPWCLWCIHLLSGIYVARLSGTSDLSVVQIVTSHTQSIPQQLKQAIRVMSEICSWVILMRIVITVLRQLCLYHLPAFSLVLITGILEISNGCIALTEVGNIGLRFILSAVFLNFGGLCVALQTLSVSGGIKQRYYLPGKILQALFGFVVAYIVQRFAFPHGDQIHLPLAFHVILIFVASLYIYSRVRMKKRCGILDRIGV